MSDVAERETVSPLGGTGAVSQAKARHPALADMIDDLEQVITPDFDKADQAAIEIQRAVKRTRLVEMAGGTIVAVLAIAQLAIGDVGAIGFVIAAIAMVTAITAGRGRGTSLDRWLDQRRVAEELRSLYFTALTSNDLRADPNRRRRVRAEVNQILNPQRELPDFEADVSADPDLDALEPEAWQLYREARLLDQISWMRGKSKTVRTRSTVLAHLQTGLMVGAALCAAGSFWVSWLAIPVAASAGLVSFVAAVDSVVASERLAQHYVRTVTRLELIDRSLGNDNGSRGDVEEIETVLMAEHRAWQRIAEGNQQ